jgi:biotin operon repressor
MPAPGYMNKSQMFEYIREKTGYGRRAVEKKLEDLEREGAVTVHDDPGNSLIKLISQGDVEKIIAALSLPPAT